MKFLSAMMNKIINFLSQSGKEKDSSIDNNKDKYKGLYP